MSLKEVSYQLNPNSPAKRLAIRSAGAASRIALAIAATLNAAGATQAIVHVTDINNPRKDVSFYARDLAPQ